MKVKEQVKSDLDKKYRKVLATPASFDFFVAIHDFVEHIESNASLTQALSSRSKPNQILNIPNKYNSLKQIYQGLEDAQVASNVDLGHARFMILRELNRIRNKEFVDSNSFWKKREVFRRLTGEVYDRLNPPMV